MAVAVRLCSLVLVLAVVPCHARELVLGEVSRGDCVPAYILDKVLTKAELTQGRRKTAARAVIHNNCSTGTEIVLSLNGTEVTLTRKNPVAGQGDMGHGTPFSGNGIRVSIRTGRLIADVPNTDLACGGRWWHAFVTIEAYGLIKRLHGTLAESC